MPKIIQGCMLTLPRDENEVYHIQFKEKTWPTIKSVHTLDPVFVFRRKNLEMSINC